MYSSTIYVAVLLIVSVCLLLTLGYKPTPDHKRTTSSYSTCVFDLYILFNLFIAMRSFSFASPSDKPTLPFHLCGDTRIVTTNPQT